MKNYLLFLVICLSATVYAQDLANKVPGNAPFALCFNGKNLNDKVALKTIQEYPWMQTLLEKELKFLPKDLSQTGIDLTNKQYQYYISKDSVMSYVMLIPLNNTALFEKLIQGKYGDSIKIKKQGTYNRTATSKTHHLAWNDKFAILVNATYTKPHKYNDNEPYSDLTSIDTATVFVDTAAAAYDMAAEPVYNLAEETKTSPTPEKNNKAKKGKTKKGKKTKKIIEEPKIVEPTEEEIYAAQDKANAELEETNRKLEELEYKKTDSIERLKINAAVDLIFKETFDSKKETALINTNQFKNNNPKSDFFAFADLDELTNQFYSTFLGSKAASMGIYKNGILDSNYHINGYFEKDRIRLSQVITPKNEETKKSYQAMFDSKIDKNLLNYVGNNVLGYYSIALDTEAIMNYEYKILKNTLNSVYQSYTKDASGKEADVLIDAIALFLDEKAIAELVPGNGIFVLHDLKKVKREYVTIEYNENYEQLETKGIKEEIQPDFTFLLNTKNESFVNKLLSLPLNKSKFTATDYQLTNGYYTIHFEKDNLLENLYIGMKNGVIMITTSKENAENLIQQKVMPLQADFKKSISKNNSAAWMDLQKIITASRTEFNKDTKSNYFDIALKNAGEITMESKFKNGVIISESTYTIKGNHANSLQYFFDVINELYTESKKETTVTE
jgi:Tfp pilus assembly major pilin PilA